MKKDIPLEVLEVIEPLLKGLPLTISIKKERDKGYILKLVDNDPESSFHFTLKEQRSSNGKDYYTYYCAPGSVSRMESPTRHVEIGGLRKVIIEWVEIVQRYEEIDIFDADPITRNYQEKFYEKWRMVDPLAEREPFDYEHQEGISRYLSYVEEKMNAYKNEENRGEVEKAILDIQDLKKKITRLPKNGVIRRLAKIWGRTQSLGLDILKEILTSTIADVAKQILLGP